MNAVQAFRQIMNNAEKVESINLKDFLMTGSISIKLKNLTDEEEEDLNHLRMNVINGAMFDGREEKRM